MEKVLAAGVRLFTLPSGNMSGDEMAQTYLANKLDLGRTLHRHRWPFIAQVSRQGVRILMERPPRPAAGGDEPADE
jgi:hypothetical protein